jgi:PTH1 family peptidyl-tRNA hydrolase
MHRCDGAQLLEENSPFMHIVTGLGNPGREYEGTRHNIGFMVLKELARRHNPPAGRTRFRAEIFEFFLGSEKVVLVAPMTYMNLSGVSVQQVMNWYKADLDDLLVVYDDLDLPLGQLRIRASGSPGGHNGLKSIVQELGTEAVPRLRVGIGRGPSTAVARVLSRFSAEDAKSLPDVIARAADMVELWIRTDLTIAMNEANRKPESEQVPSPDDSAVPEAE